MQRTQTNPRCSRLKPILYAADPNQSYMQQTQINPRCSTLKPILDAAHSNQS